MKRIANSQTYPVLEVLCGWTYVFVLIGVFIYPFFNTSLSLTSALLPKLLGSLLVITDLWLFEHRSVLARVYTTYYAGKITIVIMVALGFIGSLLW